MADGTIELGVHLCTVGKAGPWRWLARSTNPNLARFLIGLILPAFACFGVTVTDHMVTKAVNTSGGCIVPTSAATFLTTDQAVWVWFNVSDAKVGDVASATWYSPSGAAYSSASWDPLASGGGRCFWWSMNIVGYPPASSPGNWSIRVSWNGSSTFTISFVIAVPGPSVNAGGILNAASFAAGTPVAPGSMVAVFGSFGLNSPFVAPVFPLPTSLGGLSLQFAGGTKAPPYYVSGGQVSLQVPWELANQSQSSLAATLNGQSGAAQTVSLSTYSPGIFSVNAQGTGQGAILDRSYRLMDSSDPATAGVTYVSIYCTGLGPVVNQPGSGAPSPANPPAVTTATPSVTIGGQPAQLRFSELAPGDVGVYQVDALVPAGVTPGNAVPVVISIGGVTSNTVTMAVKAGPPLSPATLTSVDPNSASAGQVLTAVLTGTNTDLVQGQALASFGAGISVGGAPEGQPGALTVASPTSATARLTIDPLAAPGARTVTVSSGTQSATLSNAFTVLAASAPMGPLTITSTSPANSATGVSITSTIQIVFNEPLDPSTVGPSTFGIANGNTGFPVTAAYDSAKNQVLLSPAGTLSPQTTYTVTIGASLRNAAESPLGAPATFSFTTVAPPSINGAITPPTGISSGALSVLSFGGYTSTPSSNGAFTASLNPAGVGLVAALVPGKDFGLLTATVSGAALTNSGSGTTTVGLLAASSAATPASRQVYRTTWQVTASPLAAISPNSLVVDFQTTAEMLVFMSPHLFTADPQGAQAVLAAIAANPATAQLAQAVTQNSTKADPLTEPAVQSAAQNAIQAVVRALAQSASAAALPSQPLASSGTASIQEPGATASSASSPVGVAVTPYCWPGLTAPGGGLPCLDLDYVSFPAGSVSVNQSNGAYGFTPRNCTNKTGGCAVEWLAKIRPILPSSGGGNLASITAAGPDAFGPESPIGPYDAPCSTFPCYSAWLKGNSAFQYLSISRLMVTVMASALHLDNLAGTSFTLPANAQQGVDYGDYIARFYSGGIADPGENSNINDYPYLEGAGLAAQAYLINVLESAVNLMAAVPGVDTATDLLNCAVLKGMQDITTGAVVIGNASTLSVFVDDSRNVGSALFKDLGTCGATAGVKTLANIAVKILIISTGVGAIVQAVITSSNIAANVGQAVQRGWELFNDASAVETAVISLKPGSALVNNPVPSITSLSPSSAPVGASAQSVTIRGNYFLTTSTVAANNAKRTVTVGNGGELSINLNSSDLAQAGTFAVAVTNSQPGGGTAEAIFTVTGANSSNPQPQITSLKPSSATAGTSTLALSILGKNFMPNCIVTFNGSPRTLNTPLDAGQLTIALSAQDLAKVGVFPVVVTNPGAGNPPSTFNFTVLDANSSSRSS